MTKARVEDPARECTTSACRPVAAAIYAATLPSVARPEVEDMVKPFTLAPSALNNATIATLLLRVWHTPATVAMVALSLSSLERIGHQEDNDYPAPARHW